MRFVERNEVFIAAKTVCDTEKATMTAEENTYKARWRKNGIKERLMKLLLQFYGRIPNARVLVFWYQALPRQGERNHIYER